MLGTQKRTEILRLRLKGQSITDIGRTTKTRTYTVSRICANYKRVVVISDTHCGDRSGLTPMPDELTIDNPNIDEWQRQRIEMWQWYEKTMAALQPIDVLVVDGDCIAGKGTKSGGTELLTADRVKQVEMAEECIRLAKAPQIVMTYGTPYHTGTEEDWEAVLANNLKKTTSVSISGHEWFRANNIVFDVKHYIGNSSIPHGRMTPIARAKLWNIIWNSDNEKQPKSQIILRGHVHNLNYCGGADWMGFTLPCLQGWGDKFGVRRCEGKIDIGLLWFDIPKDAVGVQDISFRWDIPSFTTQTVEVRKIL